jgi:hypothetical protein
MLGSYYAVTPDMYQPPPPATPGWQQAPVPGWGTNPMRAGPKRVGVGGGCRGCGQAADKYRTMTAGHVALAGAAGILAGMSFMWVWHERKR